jgi:hypothetical protein
MSDGAISSVDSEPASALQQALAELERRVQALEVKVATLPDTSFVEARVTQQVKASLPPPPPPPEPIAALPSLKDIALPIPNAQTLLETAQTTLTLFTMLSELRLMFWTLFDRRYNMAWPSRILAFLLLVAILSSHFWLPFAAWDRTLSPIWDKFVDLFLSVVLFMVLIFETRRYKEWRARQTGRLS